MRQCIRCGRSAMGRLCSGCRDAIPIELFFLGVTTIAAITYLIRS